MKKQHICLWIAAILGAVAISSCNTVGGAGRDIERVGDKVQDAAH
ncbi:MAG: entericidin A/B family lipoprotein [Verrucomicrobiota bacterium]